MLWIASSGDSPSLTPRSPFLAWVPEIPRWLFIHGREREGDRIVADIEEQVRAEDGDLPEPSGKITIRQRRSISMALIARTVFTLYPRRSMLCFALFIGQVFLYNAFFFTYGDTLTTFVGVKQTGWYIAFSRPATSSWWRPSSASRLRGSRWRISPSR